MRFRITVLAAISCAPALAAQGKPTESAATLVVGAKDFQQLRWIEGKWRGTSDSGPGIVQRFHFSDDSTLVTETFASVKSVAPSRRESYTLRNGKVVSHGNPDWVLDGLDTVSASFRPPAGAPGTLIWRREASDEWVAVRSWPPTPDKPARSETYHMKKIG